MSGTGNAAFYNRAFPRTPTPTTPPLSRYTTQDPFDLAGMTNAFMTQQALQPFLANLPDYSAMTQQRSANIGAGLRGEVPVEVTNLLRQQGAEGAAGRGMAPTSPSVNSAWLQALGLTSLGRQKQAGEELSTAIRETPVPELFNPASLFLPERFAEREREEYNRRNPQMTFNTPARYVPYSQFAPAWGSGGRV